MATPRTSNNVPWVAASNALHNDTTTLIRGAGT